jgi:hypothetical protein
MALIRGLYLTNILDREKYPHTTRTIFLPEGLYLANILDEIIPRNSPYYI